MDPEIEQEPEDELVDPEGELPPEPEYDEEGNLIETEPEGEAEDEMEQGAEDTPPAYTPPSFDGGEPAATARFRELLQDEEVAEAYRESVRAEVAQQMQAMNIANIHVTTAAAEHPELFRQYGGRIQQTLSELPAETRSRPEAVHIAIARVVMEDAPKAGLGKTLRRLADLAEGGSAPARSREPKAPIPAAQRPPSPAIRSMAPTPNKDKIQVLMARYDVSKAEAEDMLAEVSRPLAGGGRRPL